MIFVGEFYVCINLSAVVKVHFVSKNVPTFNSVTLSNLNRFWEIVHCWKAYEICYKTHLHYSPHLRHVATRP